MTSVVYYDIFSDIIKANDQVSNVIDSLHPLISGFNIPFVLPGILDLRCLPIILLGILVVKIILKQSGEYEYELRSY